MYLKEKRKKKKQIGGVRCNKQYILCVQHYSILTHMNSQNAQKKIENNSKKQNREYSRNSNRTVTETVGSYESQVQKDFPSLSEKVSKNRH